MMQGYDEKFRSMIGRQLRESVKELGGYFPYPEHGVDSESIERAQNAMKAALKYLGEDRANS